jgi:DNA repair exonuclease SbcCD nuclease subunit
MRIAHLADLHLGARQYHRLTARGRNQREVDVGTAFVRAVDAILGERPDVVLVAGDLFHAVRPSNSAILLAYQQFARLRRGLPDAPIVVIAGNHDTPRSSDTVSIFGLLHELGVYVAHDAAKRFDFPDLDLAVLAVPHAALFEVPRPAMEPAGTARYQVLMTHGEVPGLFGSLDRSMAEAGGAHLDDIDLTRTEWSYVALGHYHVQHEVHPRVWYSGSLDYVSPNPWGELRVEAAERIAGKGWLLVDLATDRVERRPIEPPRRILDLRAIDAKDRTAVEVDRLIAEAVAAIPDGVHDAVVRLVVRDIERVVARELDHAPIRAWKAAALHFQLDLRRPLPADAREESGAPRGRQTLPEMLESYLAHRPLPASVERSRFVAEGLALLEAAEQAAAEG